MNKLISAENRVFIPLAGISETLKLQLINNWLKLEHFKQSLQKLFFLSTVSTTLR